jgi:putative colanic acid biosynthesis UDP-glucose lipid carrier transferase
MHIRNIESSFVWLHRVLDIIVPIAILALIASIYQIPWHDRYSIMGLLGGLALTFFNQMTGVYTGWRGRSLFAGFKKILQAWGLTWMFLIVLAFMLKDAANFSRLTITLWAFVTPIALLGYRFIIRLVMARLRTRGWSTKKIALIGAGTLGQCVVETLNNAKMFGYNPIAFYDDDSSKIGTVISGIPVAGTINELLALSSPTEKYDEIYIALPLREEDRIKQILNALSDSSITVKFIPDFFSFDLLHSRLTDVGGIPIISVYDSPLNSTGNAIVKRIEDITASILILTLISPILLAIAIAIKATSKGPVIFRQRRYGISGDEITILKFRTMTVCDDGNEITQATKCDARITKLGNFLRRTSLDELPQFFNVITGEMSIVGPRPHACAHNEQYRKLIPKYMLRHLVKPGITGWAQIHGWRGETDTLDKMEKRVEFDLYYIDNWSLWMDIRIILLTFFKGFINKNAY